LTAVIALIVFPQHTGRGRSDSDELCSSAAPLYSSTDNNFFIKYIDHNAQKNRAYGEQKTLCG
jgi:hypothetical protein